MKCNQVAVRIATFYIQKAASFTFLSTDQSNSITSNAFAFLCYHYSQFLIHVEDVRFSIRKKEEGKGGVACGRIFHDIVPCTKRVHMSAACNQLENRFDNRVSSNSPPYTHIVSVLPLIPSIGSSNEVFRCYRRQFVNSFPFSFLPPTISLIQSLTSNTVIPHDMLQRDFFLCVAWSFLHSPFFFTRHLVILPRFWCNHSLPISCIAFLHLPVLFFIFITIFLIAAPAAVSFRSECRPERPRQFDYSLPCRRQAWEPSPPIAAILLCL